MSIRVDANLLIDGTGGKIKNASVVIEEGKISYVGSSSDSPEAAEVFKCEVVMPGMWEVHGHFSGFSRPAVEEALFTSGATAGARATYDLKELLKSGITSVREVGGLGVYLKKVVDEGTIPGPTIYAAGKILSTTGGHGDIHNVPLEIAAHLGETMLGRLVDGSSECLKGVREQIRDGADIIKICASGGVMSKVDNPIHQQFGLEEIRSIVEEARRSEMAVAAHCHGAAGILAALEGGCTTIEHGTYLDEKLADLMIEKGAILVPTRYIIHKLSLMMDDASVPAYARKKLGNIVNRHEQSLRLAIKKGVPIAMGTDIFVSGSHPLMKHGENALELVLLVEFGMSPMDAIIAATSMGPKTLGKRAPMSGQIARGYDGDLLLLSKNPLDDISVLTDRSNIIEVIKGGIPSGLH